MLFNIIYKFITKWEKNNSPRTNESITKRWENFMKEEYGWHY